MYQRRQSVIIFHIMIFSALLVFFSFQPAEAKGDRHSFTATAQIMSAAVVRAVDEPENGAPLLMVLKPSKASFQLLMGGGRTVMCAAVSQAESKCDVYAREDALRDAFIIDFE